MWHPPSYLELLSGCCLSWLLPPLSSWALGLSSLSFCNLCLVSGLVCMYNKPAISGTAEIRCHCSRDIRSVLCLAVQVHTVISVSDYASSIILHTVDSVLV